MLSGPRADADADADDKPKVWVLAKRLAGPLAERGDLDGPRIRADAGDSDVAWPLAELLASQGRGEEAERVRRLG